MPAADDLKTHASGSTDFYALLGLEPGISDSKALDRAWRRTALKYHPDKVGPDNVEARDTFHLANIGYEILSDPTLRQLYDRTRAARLQREQHLSQLAAGRRAAREDLEARERGAKRSAADAFGGAFASRGEGPGPGAGVEDDEAKLEREIRRLAEDGRRRREALEKKMRQEVEELKQEEEKANEGGGVRKDEKPDTGTGTASSIPASDLDRTLRVRFSRKGSMASYGAENIKALLNVFGEVEFAFDRKDKKARREEDGKKELQGTVMLVFRSLVSAHAAVETWKRTQARDPAWESIVSVTWAGGQEPAAVEAWGTGANASSTGANQNATQGVKNDREDGTSASREWGSNGDVKKAHGSGPRVPAAPTPSDIDGLRGTKPSFGSFKASKEGNPFVGGDGGTPSLEELTMMRLRHAERRRLEAERERESDAKE